MFYTNVKVLSYYKFCYIRPIHGRQYSETYFIEILCFQRKQYFSLLTLSKSINNVKQNISVKMSNGKRNYPYCTSHPSKRLLDTQCTKRVLRGTRITSSKNVENTLCIYVRQIQSFSS